MKYGITVIVSLFFQLALFAQTTDFDVPTLIGDTTICEAYPIQLAMVDDSATTTTYIWSPADAFADPTDPNAIINPRLNNQVYTLISTSADSTQRDTQRVTVDIIPSRIDILNGDVQEVCAPYDSAVLRAVTTPPGSDIAWSPSAVILTNFGDSISVNPSISVTYSASYTANGCFQSDTVLLKVDSLPQDMSITLDPFKDPYCIGDTFFLRSPIYDSGDFTGIIHEWRDAPGLQTGDSLYNGYVVAQDTSMFMRISTNGACTRTDSVQVNVVQPPVMSLTPMDTTICPGGEVPLVFEIIQGTSGTLMWSPEQGLSCTDCFTPTATPSQPTTYMATLTAEGSDCTFPISANISFFPPLALNVRDAVICPGGSIRPFQGDPQPGITYRITGPGGLDTNDPLTVFTPTETTTYTYTALNPCGDMLTATSTVTIIEPVEISFDAPANTCAGDEQTFTATTNAPSGQSGFFEWSVNGVVAPDGGLQSFTTTLPEGEVMISVSYTNDCETVSATRTIQVSGELPEPEVIITDANGEMLMPGDTVFNGDQVTFTATDPVGQMYNYSWNGDGNPTSGEGTTITATVPSGDAETMTYTLTYTNDAGCDATVEVLLNIQQATFKIPDLITPNDDRTNDLFRVFYNGNVTEFKLLIFNRWGQIVYESTDPTAGWDGKVKGEPQPMDTYLYKARFIQNGQPQEADGQFALVR